MSPHAASVSPSAKHATKRTPHSLPRDESIGQLRTSFIAFVSPYGTRPVGWARLSSGRPLRPLNYQSLDSCLRTPTPVQRYSRNGDRNSAKKTSVGGFGS